MRVRFLVLIGLLVMALATSAQYYPEHQSKPPKGDQESYLGWSVPAKIEKFAPPSPKANPLLNWWNIAEMAVVGAILISLPRRRYYAKQQ